MNQIKNHLQSRRVLPPIPQPPLLRGYKKCETCFKVTGKLDNLKNAEFECLNCNFVLCKECLDLHFQHPNNESHRVLKLLDNGMYAKTENDFCPEHRERLKYYCFDDEKPLCVVCANYENHRHHLTKSIEDIIEEEEKYKKDLQVKITEKLKEVDTNIGFFKTAKEALAK